jgi:hypothetical protein
MTVHFSNILTFTHFKPVSWERRIYVDGFLLQIALFVVTFKFYRKRSGLNFHEDMNKKLNSYLLAEYVNGIESYIILPFWGSTKDIVLSQDLIHWIERKDRLVIGISSPKQDYLAELLNKRFPGKEFFCLGAAVYAKPIIKSENVLVTWSTMFFRAPRRTIAKFRRSIIVFVKTILFKRNEIKLFSKLISDD